MSHHEHQLLFAAAIELEVAALRQSISTLPTYGGSLMTSNVLVAGVGRTGDAKFVRALKKRPDAVINVGLAGGISVGSSPGDVVVPLVWKDPDRPMEPIAYADTELTQALLRSLRRSGLAPTTGSSVTVNRPVHGTVYRGQLRTAGVDLVEMEGASWARFAADEHVPFAAVRVISDHADLQLPDYRHRIIELTGRIRWFRWARALACNRNRKGLLEELRRLQRARNDWVLACARLEELGHALAKTGTNILAQTLPEQRGRP